MCEWLQLNSTVHLGFGNCMVCYINRLFAAGSCRPVVFGLVVVVDRRELFKAFSSLQSVV